MIEPTLASTWSAVSGGPVTDRLLEWPPDVFALTNVVLARAVTAWAEGVAEAAAYAPEHIEHPLDEARAGATWRAALGLPQPSPRLSDAMESLGRIVRAAATPPGTNTLETMLAPVGNDHPGEGTLDALVRHALLSMLEERATRHSSEANSALWPPGHQDGQHPGA